MKLTKECIGEKIKLVFWKKGEWFIPRYIGKKYVVGDQADDMEQCYSVYGAEENFTFPYTWEYYEEPKKIVRYAPALVKNLNVLSFGNTPRKTSYSISTRIFPNEDAAKHYCQDTSEEFIKWPANDSMWCEIEE